MHLPVSLTRGLGTGVPVLHVVGALLQGSDRWLGNPNRLSLLIAPVMPS